MQQKTPRSKHIVFAVLAILLLVLTYYVYTMYGGPADSLELPPTAAAAAAAATTPVPKDMLTRMRGSLFGPTKYGRVVATQMSVRPSFYDAKASDLANGGGGPRNTAGWTLAQPPVLFVYEPTRDRHVSRSVIEQGSWENNLVSAVLGAFEPFMPLSEDGNSRSSPTNHGIFLEVGANIGTWSIPVSSYGIETVAVEASPDNFDLLRRSWQINALDGRLHLVNKAVSKGTTQAGSSTLCFKQTDGNHGMSHVEPSGQGCNHVVPITTIDDILSAPHLRDKPVVAMKMDIEGYEPMAFEGARQLFESSTRKPRMIMLELSPSYIYARNGGDPHGMMRQLCDLGYAIFDAMYKTDVSCEPEQLKTYMKQFDSKTQTDLIMYLGSYERNGKTFKA